MNHSKIIALALVGVVSALVLVQAGQYGSYGARGNNGGGHSDSGALYSEGGHALAHYGGGSCHGYGCNNQAPRSASHGPYGPYHSYAVRPVIYGGKGMYHYKGYARHAPAPANNHYRYARSYGMAPRRHPASYGCRGYHCGAAAAPARHHYVAPARNHYAPAPARHHHYAQAAPAKQHYAAPAAYTQATETHHVKPITAILLVAEHPSHDHHGSSSYGNGDNHYGSASGHNSHNSHNNYNSHNNHAYQQQESHHGGHQQKHYGGNGGY